MTDTPPLVLYDISSPVQPRSYVPNPSKSRLALSFKRLHFATRWIDLLDLESVRKGLNCPATRTCSTVSLVRTSLKAPTVALQNSMHNTFGSCLTQAVREIR